MLKDLVAVNRSYRRFNQDEKVSRETLKELVDLARMAGCTGNHQPLKYYLAAEPNLCEKIYPTLLWARDLPDWDGPEEGERPSAYIIVLCDQTIGKNKMWDEGIAAQTIMLGAAEKGLGGCMIGSFNRQALAEVLELDTERYAISLVLALGKPKEKVVVVPAGQDGSVKYYRDENQIHYLPTRSLAEILV